MTTVISDFGSSADDLQHRTRAAPMSLAAARAIIDANAYMTLATADAEGMPWASPVWFAHDAFSDFLWVSRPTARHSRNVAVRPQVGIVIFDSTVAVGQARAVYLEASATEVRDHELEHAIRIFSERSEAQGAPAWTAVDVTAGAPHRLYRRSASSVFILTTRDERLRVRVDDHETM